MMNIEKSFNDKFFKELQKCTRNLPPGRYSILCVGKKEEIVQNARSKEFSEIAEASEDWFRIWCKTCKRGQHVKDIVHECHFCKSNEILINGEDKSLKTEIKVNENDLENEVMSIINPKLKAVKDYYYEKMGGKHSKALDDYCEALDKSYECDEPIEIFHAEK